MIQPELRSIMSGSTACDTKNAADKLTASTLYPAVAGGDDRALLGEAAGDRGAAPARAAGDEHDRTGHPWRW